jgi:hypothetical protein
MGSSACFYKRPNGRATDRDSYKGGGGDGWTRDASVEGGGEGVGLAKREMFGYRMLFIQLGVIAV